MATWHWYTTGASGEYAAGRADGRRGWIVLHWPSQRVCAAEVYRTREAALRAAEERHAVAQEPRYGES